MLQCNTVCYSVLVCNTVGYSVLACNTVCYSVLQPLLRRSSSEKLVINQYNENLRSIQHQEQNHDDHLGYDGDYDDSDDDDGDDDHQSVGCIPSFCLSTAAFASPAAPVFIIIGI